MRIVGNIVQTAKILIAGIVGLVDSHGIGDGTRDEPGLLAIHVVIVARAAQSLGVCHRHARCVHSSCDGAGERWLGG